MPVRAVVLSLVLLSGCVGKKKYDAYLRFSSTEDEEAYRARSDDRERYIRDQLALGTPEGNLNAARAMREQLKDAGAHGADAHPDFAGDRDRLMRDTEALAKGIAAASPQVQKAEDRALESAERAPASPSPGLDAIAAQLRAAGVVNTPASTQGHGATASLPESSTIQRV